MFGKRKSVYSWRLTESNPYPKGKRKDISLREKEKEVEKALRDAVTTNGGNMTVLELVQKYISQKRGVKHNTKANYNFVINVIKSRGLKVMKIAQNLAQMKDKLCKVIKNYAENVNKSTITEILQNCCKCRKYSKI